MKNIMEVLGLKFTHTFAEKTQIMIEKIAKLQQIEENEDEEQIWDKFGELMSEFGKMKLEKCPKYMLGMMLVTGLEKGKKIMKEEKQRLMDVMEDEERNPRSEDVVYDVLKKEYAKSKIEGKRASMPKESSDDSTFL